MTLAEFKKLVDMKLRGDVKVDELKTDGTFLLVLGMAYERVLSSPVTLYEYMEIDYRSFKTYKQIDKKYFVRTFNAPVEDTDSMDFENPKLLNALVYTCASLLAFEYRNQVRLGNMAIRELSGYELDCYGSEDYTIEDSLKFLGLYKPYEMDYSMEDPYVWNEDFLIQLDVYLMDTTQYIDPSYMRFINDFISFQDVNLQTRFDLVSMDNAMQERANA